MLEHNYKKLYVTFNFGSYVNFIDFVFNQTQFGPNSITLRLLFVAFAQFNVNRVKIGGLGEVRRLNSFKT